MNNVVKLGLILAAIGLALSLVMRYAIDVNLLFSWKFMLASFIINTIILIVLGRKFLRDPEEGRLGSGQAVKKLFIALLISTVATIIATTIIYGNDKKMEAAFEEYTINAQEAGIRWGAQIAGQSEAEQDALVEEMREQRASGELPETPYPYSWSQFPISLFFAAIMNLIFSLILALFVREPESEYA